MAICVERCSRSVTLVGDRRHVGVQVRLRRRDGERIAARRLGAVARRPGGVLALRAAQPSGAQAAGVEPREVEAVVAERLLVQERHGARPRQVSGQEGAIEELEGGGRSGIRLIGTSARAFGWRLIEWHALGYDRLAGMI